MGKSIIMSYVIKNEMTGKFLANRNFSNGKWWTSNLQESQAFRTLKGAEIAKSKLKYGILVIEQPIEKIGTWDYEDYKEY